MHANIRFFVELLIVGALCYAPLPGYAIIDGGAEDGGGGGGYDSTTYAGVYLTPSSVTQGNSSTLTWWSENALSCTGTGFSTGGIKNGTMTVAPSVTTTYTLSCTGVENDASGSGTLTVVPPAPELTATSPVLKSGTLRTSDPHTFLATTTNAGTQSTIATFSNKFQLDLGADGTYDVELVASNSTAGLTIGQAKAVTSPVWTATPGSHRVRFCTDLPPNTTGTVSESNENNNCSATYAFTVIDYDWGSSSVVPNARCSGGEELSSAIYEDAASCVDYCISVGAACCTTESYNYFNGNNEEPVTSASYTCSAWSGTATTPAPPVEEVKQITSPNQFQSVENWSWTATLLSYSTNLSATIVANPTTVAGNQQSLLTWSSTGAVACQGANFESPAEGTAQYVRFGSAYSTKICSGGENSTLIQKPTCESIAGFPSCTAGEAGDICKVHAYDGPNDCAGSGTVYGYVQQYVCQAALSGGTTGSTIVAPESTTDYTLYCTNGTGTWQFVESDIIDLACPPGGGSPSTGGYFPKIPSCTPGAACAGGTCMIRGTAGCNVTIDTYHCLTNEGAPITSASDTATVTVSDALSASCMPAPNPGTVFAPVTWQSSVSGGTNYTYSWSGTDGLSGTGPSVVKTYTTLGEKFATLTVTATPTEGNVSSITVDCNGATCTQAVCECVGDNCGVEVVEGTNTDLTVTEAPTLYSGLNVLGSTVTFRGTIDNAGDTAIDAVFGNRFQVDIGNDGEWDLNLDTLGDSQHTFTLQPSAQCTGGALVTGAQIGVSGFGAVQNAIEGVCELNSVPGQCCGGVINNDAEGSGGGEGYYWIHTGYLAGKCVSETCPVDFDDYVEPDGGWSCSTLGEECQICSGAPVGDDDAVTNLYTCGVPEGGGDGGGGGAGGGDDFNCGWWCWINQVVSFNVPVANQFVAALYQFLALEDYYIDVSVYASPSTPTSAGSNSYAGVWSTVTGNAFSIPLAGTAAVVSPEWESIPLGTHAVRFCADLPTESLAESNEGNNCGPSLTFSVGEGEGDGAVDISASPWLVRTGRTTTVTWSATGEFDSCVVSGAGLSSSEPNGTAVVTVTKEGTYTISCTQGETTVSDSVSVRLVPKFLEF